MNDHRKDYSNMMTVSFTYLLLTCLSDYHVSHVETGDGHRQQGIIIQHHNIIT